MLTHLVCISVSPRRENLFEMTVCCGADELLQGRERRCVAICDHKKGLIFACFTFVVFLLNCRLPVFQVLSATFPSKSMSHNLANLTSILVSAHQKLASIHEDLADKLQLEFNRINDAKISPPSPGLSDSTVEGNTRKFVEDDDDFADSPILSNSNALQRAKTIHKNPLISRMKLKKTLSEAPKRQPRSNGYLAFFAENRPKVCHLSTIVF